MEEKEQERSLRELKPYLVYFLAAHQTKPQKTMEAEPVLIMAPDAVEAVERARVMARGIKKGRKGFLEAREAEEKDFRARAEELLKKGVKLPPDVIEYAGLQDLAERLKK